MIESAEAQLRAAIGSKDPERLKQAIAHAEETRRRVSSLNASKRKAISAAQVLHGGGGKAASPAKSPAKVSVTQQLSPEAKLYDRFHEVVVERKLELVALGLEVQDVFVNELFTKAMAEGVERHGFRAFVRAELPSPRLADFDVLVGGVIHAGAVNDSLGDGGEAAGMGGPASLSTIDEASPRRPTLRRRPTQRNYRKTTIVPEVGERAAEPTTLEPQVAFGFGAVEEEPTSAVAASSMDDLINNDVNLHHRSPLRQTTRVGFENVSLGT